MPNTATEPPETLVQYAQAARWVDAWRLLHARDDAPDARWAWAVETATDAFFTALGNGASVSAEALELLVLLHSSHRIALSDARFTTAVAALVERHRAQGRPEAARHYARFAPTADVCAAVLNDPVAHDAHAEAPPAQPPPTETFQHPWSDRMAVTVVAPHSGRDASLSLFRSRQERAFFQALRRVFPTFAPYPNVALHSVLDLDRIGPQLTNDERAFFFKGLVDCVLCDPADDYRPVAFFELDSPRHNAPARRQNDRVKDRIVACAGHALYRLRPHTARATVHDFARVLRYLAHSDGAPIAFAPARPDP